MKTTEKNMLGTVHQHPYGSAVSWRIAVSRRFNDSVVNSIYEKQVLPVLVAHGIVLECNFASDETKDAEFWTNRIKRILGCSDLHILLDIHRSGSMDFEFRISGECANRMGKKSVWRYSGLEGVSRLPPNACLPIQIRVVDGEGNTAFNRIRRCVEVHALPHNLLSLRLQEAIEWAKKKRTRELKYVRIFYDPLAKWCNRKIKRLEMPTAMTVQEEMTTLAEKLAIGQPIIEANIEYLSDRKIALGVARSLGLIGENNDGALDPAAEEGADPITRLVNQFDQFEVGVRNGSICLPKRFWDAYAFIRGERARLWVAVMGREPVKWLRRLNYASAILLTVQLRKATRRMITH